MLKITFDYSLYEKVREDINDSGICNNGSKWSIEGLVTGKMHNL